MSGRSPIGGGASSINLQLALDAAPRAVHYMDQGVSYPLRPADVEAPGIVFVLPSSLLLTKLLAWDHPVVPRLALSPLGRASLD